MVTCYTTQLLGRYAFEETDDGCAFLDRDGSVLGVLAYLRDGEVAAGCEGSVNLISAASTDGRTRGGTGCVRRQPKCLPRVERGEMRSTTRYVNGRRAHA
jgi:hypothetical protein